MVRISISIVSYQLMEVSSQIRLRQEKFFSKLYASEYREDLLMLEHFGNLSQLSAQDVADLECPLALQELQVAQLSIENGRPKSFWCDVKLRTKGQ